MKIAVIGGGSIVPSFMEAAEQVEGLEVYAILGRRQSLEKFTALQERYHIPRLYHDYETLLADPAVEAVYIALPNHLHYPFAKAALERGKHALVEKPFACSQREAEELLALSQRNQVVVFEAISTQYLPNYRRTAELLERLGPVKIVQLNFTQYSSRYERFLAGDVAPVFDKEQAGGALMDLGVYNIHFALGLFGPPRDVWYLPNLQRGVDTSGVLTMRYDGFSCVSSAAKDCEGPSCLNIQGEKGCLWSDSKPNSYDSFTLALRGQSPEKFGLNGGRPRLYYELEEFAELTKNRDWERLRQIGEHTMAVQHVLDAARHWAGLRLWDAFGA